ncbi:MAG: MFS transporter [Gemmatimonadota bacterium]
MRSSRIARRWGMLAVLSLGQLFGMASWFAASAVSPELVELWSLGSQQVGWLTTSVQLGFVTGTAVAAVLNLADIVPARWYFAGSAFLAAGVNAGLLIAPGFESGLVLRFLTGAALAGVYPPAMKMTATWFRSARGLAIGVVVGALTAGKAAPYLIKVIGGARFEPVVVATSGAAVLAALLVLLLYRDGPHRFDRRPFQWSLVGTVLRHRETRLAIGGYCGHMLELYAVWAWIPVFLAARAGDGGAAVDLASFGAIATGALGCVLGGAIADRIGRARWAVLAMGASGLACLGAGLAFAAPWVVVVAFTWVWGFFVVADSAQFSAIVTEVAPSHAVGTALTLQTSLGFGLTAITLQAVPWAADLVGWQWAFGFLAAGPMLGILFMRPLVGGHRHQTPVAP